jgi:hypothetical protein
LIARSGGDATDLFAWRRRLDAQFVMYIATRLYHVFCPNRDNRKVPGEYRMLFVVGAIKHPFAL